MLWTECFFYRDLYFLLEYCYVFRADLLALGNHILADAPLTWSGPCLIFQRALGIGGSSKEFTGCSSNHSQSDNGSHSCSCSYNWLLEISTTLIRQTLTSSSWQPRMLALPLLWQLCWRKSSLQSTASSFGKPRKLDSVPSRGFLIWLAFRRHEVGFCIGLIEMWLYKCHVTSFIVYTEFSILILFKNLIGIVEVIKKKYTLCCLIYKTVKGKAESIKSHTLPVRVIKAPAGHIPAE